MKVTDELSLFGSFTYNDSEMRSNFPAAVVNGRTIYLPTKGKSYYDIPEYMAAFSAQWAYKGFFAGGQAKFTGNRYATLMNDEKVAPLTTIDLNAGYHLTEATGDIPGLKDPTIRLNVTNLLDKNYLSYISGYKNNALNYVTPRRHGDRFGADLSDRRAADHQRDLVDQFLIRLARSHGGGDISSPPFDQENAHDLRYANAAHRHFLRAVCPPPPAPPSWWSNG